jgi:hypothetical protein
MSNWLESLKKHVENFPILILRLNDGDWEAIGSSKNGFAKFSITKKHEKLDKGHKNPPCLILGSGKNSYAIYLGLVSSTNAVSTLDSRLTIRRAAKIEPGDVDSLVKTVADSHYSKQIKDLLSKNEDVCFLTANQSKHLLNGLSRIGSNTAVLKNLESVVNAPNKFNENSSFQEDAIRIALATFGLAKEDIAESVELVKGKQSGLARVSFIEDNAVELDARNINGYELVGADLTGRAKFRKGSDELEVITANRRDLEHCIGVDLIYINLTQKNVVMIQYKMLEPSDGDWIYRPDFKLDDEIARMTKFRVDYQPSEPEYRINSEFLYLKFVKRDALIKNAAILMPLEHFELLRKSRTFEGSRGGIRLSYDALRGNYLRPAPFMNLLCSGYIGSYAKTTASLKTLIDEILADNKAVIAAIQQRKG